MTPPHLRRATALLGAVVLLLTACASGDPGSDASPSPTPSPESAQERRFRLCGQLADDIASALQGWVDTFAPVDPNAHGTTAPEEPSPSPTQVDLPALMEQYAQRRAQLACRPREFEVQLARSLEDVEGQGPLGRAVASTVESMILTTTGPAAAVEVNPGDDLADAVLGADRGAVVTLAPGTYELEEPLLLLKPVTIVGGGIEETIVTSSAAGAAMAFIGDGRFVLEDLELRHEGEEPASVLLLTSGEVEVSDVRLGGGVADEQGSTGFGAVLGGAGGERSGTRRLDGVEAVDNGSGGFVVVDGAAPTLVDVTARGNTPCGICYLGRAGGELRDSLFEENEVGVVLARTADPAVERVTTRANRTVGILVEQEASGRFEGVTVADNGVAGVLVRGQAAPLLVDLDVTGHEEVAILFQGEAGGTVEGGTCEDAPFEIALLDASSPDVEDAGCEVHDQREQ